MAVCLELRNDGDERLSVARWDSSRIHSIATLKPPHQAEPLSEGSPIAAEQIEHPGGLIDSTQRLAGANGRRIVFVERQICGNVNVVPGRLRNRQPWVSGDNVAIAALIG